MSDLLKWLYEAHLTIGESSIYWREIIGNLFGLAGAVLGMRRNVWTWPVGIVGNVLLFTVFLGAVFNPEQAFQKDALWGQAGRQVFFMAVSLYGWARWMQARRQRQAQRLAGADALGSDGAAIQPRWATGTELRWLLLAGAVIFVASYEVLKLLNSWGPMADAWIFTGSILATYGMARGWSDFWLIWIAVDAVGVPLLLKAGYYPSALLYVVYGAFCLWGVIVWWRTEQRSLHHRQPMQSEAMTT